jgi:hypothetical protein
MGSTWTMSWGDGADSGSPLPYEDWAAQRVPSGSVRAVRVSLPTEPLLVAWDDQRATVRLATGELQWYVDADRQAYPREDEIVFEAETLHPRGNRYMDALVVRSLEDLIETVNAEEVTSIDEDGTIHIYGEHDNTHGRAVRAPDSGVILRASGMEGTRSWRLEVEATRLLDDAQALLEPTDVSPPSL